jgi:glycosyltransferase involved in cell wall biosynthesis
LKIAINTRFLLKNKLEGIGRVTYEIVKRLVEQHPEDEFIFFFDRPFDKSFLFGKNVISVVLNPPARHPFLWYWWFEKSIPAALLKYKVDVFLSTDNYLSLNTKVKTVMITHDLAHLYYPHEIPLLVRKFYSYYVPKYLRRADRIIAVSEFTKNDILKHFKIDENKIAVARNACTKIFKPVEEDIKKEVRKKYADNQEYFFYIGSIHPRKNIRRLILAFDQFKEKTKSSIKLLLGGRIAWQTDSIKAAFENAKHKSDISLLGYLNEEELPLILAAAKALTYVSLFEGFGLPILEAMHCDTPVITSNVTSMPEVAGEAALLVNPKAIDEIAKAMEEIQDKVLAQRLIDAGRAQREKFSWDNSAEIVYQSLVKAAKL